MNYSLWLEMLARSSVLLLASELAHYVLRRSSAALRHRVLLCVTILLALLPVLVVLMPDMPVSLWRAPAAQNAVVTVVEGSSRSIDASTRTSVNWLFLLWALGVCTACLPLIAGSVRVFGVARKAKPLEAEILISNEVRIPLTFGIFRPQIILPAESERWSSTRRMAVIQHERAHIRRRDVAVQITTHIIVALWWFQPMVWILQRRLRLESELACDAEAIRSGLRPSDYAAELVWIARSAGPVFENSGVSIAMAESSHLEKRVRAILRPSTAFARPAMAYVAAGILGSTAIAASAAGGSTMKHTILSALLTSAGLSAAGVSGTVHDTSGATLADAKVLLSNPDTGTKDEVLTGADGKFSFNNSSAGQYILRIEKPGYASIFREFDLKAESSREREFTMPNEGGASVADAAVVPDGAQDTPRAIRVGGRVAQNNLLHKVTPVYPVPAKNNHIQGTVELEASITKDGVPSELRVISSPSDDLSANALEAARQWRYRPTLLNGEPVAIITTIVINYTLAP